MFEEILRDEDQADAGPWGRNNQAHSAEYSVSSTSYGARRPLPLCLPGASPYGRLSNTRFVLHHMLACSRSSPPDCGASPQCGCTQQRQPMPHRWGDSCSSSLGSPKCVICGNHDHRTKNCQANCTIQGGLGAGST